MKENQNEEDEEEEEKVVKEGLEEQKQQVESDYVSTQNIEVDIKRVSGLGVAGSPPPSK